MFVCLFVCIYIHTYTQYFIYRKHSYMFRCICIIFRKSYPFTLLKLQNSLRFVILMIFVNYDI